MLKHMYTAQLPREIHGYTVKEDSIWFEVLFYFPENDWGVQLSLSPPSLRHRGTTRHGISRPSRYVGNYTPLVTRLDDASVLDWLFPGVLDVECTLHSPLN